ncbi:MAG: hypothetical protein VX640_00705 [Pseudomonadota bacterium]|nr:hypothetical protein [Pseudomonadota bacterium]
MTDKSSVASLERLRPATGAASADWPLTVVVVSEFEASEEKSWRNELRLLEALAGQDIEVPFNVLIVESETQKQSPPPPGLFELFPATRLVYCPADHSAAMKNFAVGLCGAPLIALIESDVTPDPGWLRRLYARAISMPEYSVFTARTDYGLDTSWRRVCSLLDRSFDDYGRSCESRHISSHAALYRASVLKDFPFPEGSPFVASRRRDIAIRKAGHRCFFEYDSVCRHDLGGFGFVMDFRRNGGHSSMMMNAHRSWRHIPRKLFNVMRSDVGSLLRVGRRYLRWRDLPLYAAMFLWARVPETIGMIDALKGADRVPGSSHR